MRVAASHTASYTIPDEHYKNTSVSNRVQVKMRRVQGIKKKNAEGDTKRK